MQLAQTAKVMHGRTHAFLPRHNGIGPNTLHVTVHVAIIAMLVDLMVLKHWLYRAVTVASSAWSVRSKSLLCARTSPWSNGQKEGQITKLKLVKRQIYGRGKISSKPASLAPDRPVTTKSASEPIGNPAVC